MIEANVLGADPTGVIALPDEYGVEIVGGAHDNTIGGTTAAAGNLISFNISAGVDVVGDSSTGNQITGNVFYDDDDRVGLGFDGNSYVSLPTNPISGLVEEETIEAWFQTTTGGVILGSQSSNPASDSYTYPGSGQLLYVGTDGKLYGVFNDSSDGPVVSSGVVVNDGSWHSVALVFDGDSAEEYLYLDGQLVGSAGGFYYGYGNSFSQIGTGEPYGDPATPSGWDGFQGAISNVQIWNVARSASEVAQDTSALANGTQSGLVAAYPFDEGQGLTAYDQTPNHNDGTRAGIGGDLPAWVAGAGVPIDLGGDGITYDGSAPRNGPNNLENFPVIVTVSGGQLEGWIGGALPDTTFEVDLYASAGYATSGAGQAEDFLGSLAVTTNSQGQAVFAVPFTPPSDLPVVTATATDPQGNTSEVSSARRSVLNAPTQYLRVVPGESLILSPANGDGIFIQDPDAGPLNPEWSLTLSVGSGTLTLTETTGLAGSGNGTGELHFQGSLSAINAALQDLTFAPAPGFEGNTVLTVGALSQGSQSLQSVVNITNGLFAVTNTNEGGPGSLRQAILDSNVATGGANTIDFAIPGGGVQVIAPLSPLPTIVNPVLIDGFSQPGYAGTPLIEVIGGQAGTGSGFTITSSNVTIRGLDINGFSAGAGILISGPASFGNVIESNDIGSDPTGSVGLPNYYGVQIVGGASGNLVGGASVGDGNLIAFNFGAGVDVLDDNSTGNQITANRIFGNDDVSALQFDGSTYVTMPNGLIDPEYGSETLEASFETTTGGVIFGVQAGDAGISPGNGWLPLLYVGTNGLLYGGSSDSYGGQVVQITSAEPVDDGNWHDVALVFDASQARSTSTSMVN